MDVRGAWIARIGVAEFAVWYYETGQNVQGEREVNFLRQNDLAEMI